MWLGSLIYKWYRPGINVKQMEREVPVLAAPLWSCPFRFILCQESVVVSSGSRNGHRMERLWLYFALLENKVRPWIAGLYLSRPPTSRRAGPDCNELCWRSNPPVLPWRDAPRISVGPLGLATGELLLPDNIPPSSERIACEPRRKPLVLAGIVGGGAPRESESALELGLSRPVPGESPSSSPPTSKKETRRVFADESLLESFDASRERSESSLRSALLRCRCGNRQLLMSTVKLLLMAELCEGWGDVSEATLFA